MSPPGAEAVDAYVAQFPPEVQDRLTRLRHVILEHLPGGEETIRYDMPAVMVGARYGLHFAGWKKHVALYPVPRLDEPLESRVSPYRTGQDTVRFLHSRDLPYELVGEICDHVAALRR
ncbi:uncharacterized protein YdhG (YjbR/CyaY superfamily) [Nocardioides cavernae]|uniref:Uncharacterized protein YdhG (YjbR/CyaY superfamily) n=1 Tax=Nocardioides cavernae TaxID=1921566 RepID=A0A7Y9H6I7_9ACTN|nr:DUF1801 domain-containing protein [Nocardioides cavernae]NYE38822.1 uncharacterized protein YdhG (YjbR/CyaY superfamily) [Nocardioides cavernae]